MSYPVTDNLPPIHPGEFLQEELEALNLSARQFAARIGVPANAITAILNGKRGISALMALRLGKALGKDPGYWSNLQIIYDAKLAVAQYGKEIDAIQPLYGSEAA